MIWAALALPGVGRVSLARAVRRLGFEDGAAHLDASRHVSAAPSSDLTEPVADMQSADGITIHLELTSKGAAIEGESTQTSLGRESTIECLSFVDGVRTA